MYVIFSAMKLARKQLQPRLLRFPSTSLSNCSTSSPFHPLSSSHTQLPPRSQSYLAVLTQPSDLCKISKFLSKTAIFDSCSAQSTSLSCRTSRPISKFCSSLFPKSSNYLRPDFKTIIRNTIWCGFTQSRPAFSSSSDSFLSNLDPNELNQDKSAANSPFESELPIDASSSIRRPISLWPGMYHSPVTNTLWEARSTIFEKPQDTPSVSELKAKTPSRSRTSVHYKFSSDYILREQYRNPWNEIRIGKLLEDLDALAGTISFKHCCIDDSTTKPLLLVTASVDKMVLKKPILVDTDLTIVGAVTWVGRSSIEIQLEVIQSTLDSLVEINNQSDSIALVANFTFVARDTKTGKSTPVNQIAPETEAEKLLWKEAEERNKTRKKKKTENKKGFGDKDMERLNALLSEGRVFSDMPALADRNSILIRNTCLENSFICQPQQRNIHGRIFGGFLMRRAFELAFSTTYVFAGVAPHFLEVDHVDFFKPVDVGNFLRLKSCVLYTELEDLTKPLINVEVVAHVTKPELRSSEVSNKFYFTFSVPAEAIESGLRIRTVVPTTEEEAQCVLERIEAESS